MNNNRFAGSQLFFLLKKQSIFEYLNVSFRNTNTHSGQAVFFLNLSIFVMSCGRVRRRHVGCDVAFNDLMETSSSQSAVT